MATKVQEEKNYVYTFYALDSAAMGIRVILEELRAPQELIPTTIDGDKPVPAEKLTINPYDWIPILPGLEQ